MIHRETWHREAAGEADLSALLRKREQGEPVDGEIKALARRVGYPAIVPKDFYQHWWIVANMAYGNPEIQADLPGLFKVLYPDFTRELWERVNNWDPRQLKEFFEGDRTLQDAKEMSWEEPEDFEEQQGYGRGFFDAVDFVTDELAPAFDSALDQLKGRGYVSQPSLGNLSRVFGEYVAHDRADGESHQGIIEDQLRSAQVQSERLHYINMANRLDNERGPVLGLLEEFGEDIPQSRELKAWDDEVWRVLARVADRFRNISGHDLVRLKELDKEWTEKWNPLLEAFEEQEGVNRYDYYEESS